MKLNCNKARDFVKKAIMNVGVSNENATHFANCLIEADMRGMSSHGVTRLKTYYDRCKQGLVDPKAVPEIICDNPSLLAIDGKNALGFVSATFAMKECIKRAKKTGACFATVKGGNHFGLAAYYTQMAEKEGMIGFAISNGPVAIPPIGGREPVLGTSPLAVAIPTDKSNPLELDMATSYVARGKIKLAAKEGRSIPADWAIDANGNPTTDPNAVKYLMPFGGPKGFGIGLIIEVLCSCLSGAKNAMTMGSLYDFSGKHQDAGFFVGAIDISALMPVDKFKSAVDDLFTTIKNSPKAEGVEEIYTPGEIEIKKAQKAEIEGIEVGPAVLEELNQVAFDSGIAFDCEE